MKTPVVLLTNDDGMHAPGIRAVYDVLNSRTELVVVAPDREQSGVGHAFTFNAPIHYEKTPFGHIPPGFVVSGSPVDCVKFAVSHLLQRRPDIVVSGLNIGENSGLSAFYSGTVAAAREGAFWNIPSIAFSLCEEGKEHLNEYAAMVPQIMLNIVAADAKRASHEERIFYNVNFPGCSPERVRGTLVTRQSRAFFDDRYERIDVAAHRTGEGFIIRGEKIDIEPSDEVDSRALMNGYITVTPLSFDATIRSGMDKLRTDLESIDRCKVVSND